MATEEVQKYIRHGAHPTKTDSKYENLYRRKIACLSSVTLVKLRILVSSQLSPLEEGEVGLVKLQEPF